MRPASQPGTVRRSVTTAPQLGLTTRPPPGRRRRTAARTPGPPSAWNSGLRIMSGVRGRGRSMSMISLIRPGPRAHHRDLVGEEDRLVDAVGDQQRGRRLLGPDAQQLEVEVLPGHVVERAERLVEQQHRGLERQRARDRDPLPHAARELRRLGVLEAREADQLDQLLDVGLVDLAAGDLERQLDVLAARCATAAARGPGRRCRARCPCAAPSGVLPSTSAVPDGRLLEAREDPQDRGLAAARRAEQREERALVGVQVGVLQGGDAAAARRTVKVLPSPVTWMPVPRRAPASSGGRARWSSVRRGRP